jgi:hypothetical protein
MVKPFISIENEKITDNLYNVYILIYYYNKDGHYVVKRTSSVDIQLANNEKIKDKIANWKKTDNYKGFIKNLLIDSGIVENDTNDDQVLNIIITNCSLKKKSNICTIYV